MFMAAKISPEARARGLNQYFIASERDLAGGVFDPRAEKLLRAAEAFTKVTFNLPSLKYVKAVTRQEEGDVLVVKWTMDEPFAKGVVFLQDEPNFSRYEFRLANCEIHSKEDVEAFLSKLVVWRKPPNNIMPGGFEVRLLIDDRPIKAFFGDITTLSVIWLRNMEINAAALGENEWLVTVKMGKGFTSTYYPIAPFVPERFPPLAELVQSWSFERISSELGKATYPQFRDDVLVTEVIRRGLSEEQFVALIGSAEPPRLESRAQVVLIALYREGKGDLAARYFGPALAKYEQIGQAANGAVETLFRFAARNCSTFHETHAVRLLREGTFQTGPLMYVGHCSASEETLLGLEHLALPDKLADQKDSAIMDIRRRLGKTPR